jgi:hypothetical protein
MHDLSDGMAIVGPRSQARVLPAVNTENVELRADSGQAYISIAPDNAIELKNPNCQITLDSAGAIAAQAQISISLTAPLIMLNGALMANSGAGGTSISSNGAVSINAAEIHLNQKQEGCNQDG